MIFLANLPLPAAPYSASRYDWPGAARQRRASATNLTRPGRAAHERNQSDASTLRCPTQEHLKAFPQPASVHGVHTREKVEDENYLQQEAASIKVGDRCQVAGGRRGEVMFVGRVPELPLGFWVGVKYDEPVGKNDGTVKGVRYFECLDKYGGFVRPDLCEVGDFPEEDPFADLDDEM